MKDICFVVALLLALGGVFYMCDASAEETRHRVTIDGKPATCFIQENDYAFFCVRDRKYYNLFGMRINLPISKEEQAFRKSVYKF